MGILENTFLFSIFLLFCHIIDTCCVIMAENL